MSGLSFSFRWSSVAVRHHFASLTGGWDPPFLSADGDGCGHLPLFHTAVASVREIPPPPISPIFLDLYRVEFCFQV